ncbi:flagellar basal body rod protein FlgF [Parerythrobacter lacustris]|uniref:Flagellar basal-body rod protein FlgF n=1 Tax=Parerythrobacter lacustris TaxID=2969984 RepID=A0ABT1XM80_9SPHN|nr:flagellar basal body rod protein FlgF [Parerythrobacter lacustris]MCR2832766.1 flagellar basal body rod protein FlgF [Parerythrobacter lacustris]
MDRMIYTALTGMDAAMTRQRAIASNLANASTPGFRAETFATVPTHLPGGALDVRGYAQGAVRGVDLGAGTMVQTGRALDIAVAGEALIAFQGENGEEVYSRRGDFSIDSAGRLVNGENLQAMGLNGPVAVPPGWEVILGSDGNVYAADPAAPDAPPTEVGRIKLASPAGSAVVKGLDNQLRVQGGGVLPADPTAEITSGALEGSNVDASGTLVDMIEAQRSFEQRAKLISTAEKLDQSSASLMSLG